MRLEHMSRTLVQDYITEQAQSEGKEPSGFKIRIVSHERVRVLARTVLTTSIDNDSVWYEVIHNVPRKEAYLSVYQRTEKQRVSYAAFQAKHLEYEINTSD